jgi:ribosome-associated protein
LDKEQVYHLVENAANIAVQKKARDVVSFDLSSITALLDYQLLMTCETPEHCRATAGEIAGAMKGKLDPPRYEGEPDSGWMVLDFNFFVVNLFLEKTRDYYRLERIWGDLPSRDYA